MNRIKPPLLVLIVLALFGCVFYFYNKYKPETEDPVAQKPQTDTSITVKNVREVTVNGKTSTYPTDKVVVNPEPENLEYQEKDVDANQVMEDVRTVKTNLKTTVKHAKQVVRPKFKGKKTHPKSLEEKASDDEQNTKIPNF